MRKIWIGVLVAALVAVFLALRIYPRVGEIIPTERVSVIYIQGAIVTGSSGIGYTSADDVVKTLRKMRDDPFVKAVVLRINSPGGTPAACEEIMEEVRKVRREKPVVVSMGDIATSGAYYISALADEIFANPDTITGSIGAYYVFENKTGYYEDEGINYTVVKSGEYKDMGANWRGPTSAEVDLVQNIVDEVHKRLLGEVASERNLSKDVVDKISDGRILTGSQAMEMGLVDAIGNLYDAIDRAWEMAGMTGTPRVEYIMCAYCIP